MLDDICWRYIGKNKIIQLSRNEVILLRYIITNNKVSTYKMLEKELYGEITGNRKFIIAIICRLRKKLKGELEIKTKNQIGYYI